MREKSWSSAQQAVFGFGADDHGIGYWIVKTKSSSVQSDCSLVSDEKMK